MAPSVKRHSCSFALLACALSALVLALPAIAQAAYPGANGRVAYESNNGGADKEIMSAAYDGSGSVQLTTNTVDDVDPAWSPDGSMIAFSRLNSGTGRFELWTMNANGSTQTPLLSVAGDLTHPTWSPDGSQIAFSRSTAIFKVNVAGGPATLVTDTAADEFDPAWSPVDANKILFSYEATPASDVELRTVNPNTNVTTPLLAIAGKGLFEAAWSADGSRIAYMLGPDFDIYTANADGTGQAAIAASGATEGNPAWSPQGNMLAHETSAGGGEIATKNTPSGGASILEARPATIDTDPDWQPVITAQVRAQGATPVHLALTLAFKDCLTPNAAHAPPLVHATCTPPEQVSDDLIVGEPLVNGKAARFNGNVRIRNLGGTDLQLTASLADVRCARFLAGNCTGGPLSDFTGNLSLRYEAYVVDRMATLTPPVPPGSRAGSSSLLGFDFLIPCASTVDPNVGSTCSLTTSINTVFPGGIVATRRSSWTLGSVVVKDAPGGKVFAVPGNFVP